MRRKKKRGTNWGHGVKFFGPWAAVGVPDPRTELKCAGLERLEFDECPPRQTRKTYRGGGKSDGLCPRKKTQTRRTGREQKRSLKERGGLQKSAGGKGKHARRKKRM